MKEATKRTYSHISAEFYHKTKHSLNPISSWYINHRHSLIKQWVTDIFKPGIKIIDLGSGGSLWNEEHLPVFGVDLNQNLLRYGKERGYLADFFVGDFEEMKSKEDSYDVVILSEVLEHLDRPRELLKKAKCMMKKDGKLIVTVPFDTPFSLWRYLFLLQCVLKGELLGNEYYRKRCGHVKSFSPDSLCALMNSVGLEVIRKRTAMRMNIAVMAVESKSN